MSAAVEAFVHGGTFLFRVVNTTLAGPAVRRRMLVSDNESWVYSGRPFGYGA